MRFKTMATINAVIFIVMGAAFLLLGWEIISAYGGPEVPIPNGVRVAWMLRVSSFTSLYGLALLGGGLVIWAIRNIRDVTMQTNVSLALFGMNALAATMALKQEIGLWKSPLGAITVAIFFAQAIGYCWLLVVRRGSLSASFEVASEPGVETLREQWAQQIHEAAAQQERNRLARELHDSIKQQLFSINVSAATVQARWETDGDGARAALEAVRDSVREAMAEMEAMLHNLRPAPLETVGLVEALRQQCESLQYRAGAQVTAEIGELPANRELPVGAQDAIFRIAQEALANIARHARAQNVRVRLHRHSSGDEDALWLKIEDDGSGFDVTSAPAGMGLANIRSRVLEIGGSLQLESREGEGTSLTVRVPLVTTEVSEIRRELRTALVFAIVGFFVGEFAKNYSTSSTMGLWAIVGGPFFALSAIGCLRAGKAIKLMKTAESALINKVWELEIFWRQVRFFFYATLVLSLVSSVMEWLLTREIFWMYFLWRFWGYVLVALLLSLQIIDLWRVNQIIKSQLALSSPQEFHRSIRRLWLHDIWAILLAAPFFGLTLFYGSAVGVFMLLDIALLLCWLLPTGGLIWHKLRFAKNDLMEGNYDSSRVGRRPSRGQSWGSHISGIIWRSQRHRSRQ